MRTIAIALSFAALAMLHGCATDNIPLTPQPAWDGQVFVSQGVLPEGIKYTVVGTITVDQQVSRGYGFGPGISNVATTQLYPALASQARKVGANAVINTTVGERVVWGGSGYIPMYVRGTAVRVENPKLLKGRLGTFH